MTSGNRYTWVYRGELHVNPDRAEMTGRGWVALVHDLSHFAHRRLNPGVRPHSGTHARLELSMIKEVIKRGWLFGSLKKPEKPQPEKRDERAIKFLRVEAAIILWERKLKRAQTALKKLERQRRYYARSQAQPTTLQ
jgi:hypothetical protein